MFDQSNDALVVVRKLIGLGGISRCNAEAGFDVVESVAPHMRGISEVGRHVSDRDKRTVLVDDGSVSRLDRKCARGAIGDMSGEKHEINSCFCVRIQRFKRPPECKSAREVIDAASKERLVETEVEVVADIARGRFVRQLV